MKEKPLREKIANYLEKAIKEKTETVFVPCATHEFQDQIHPKKILEMADAIIPMVKGNIKKKNSNQLEPQVLKKIAEVKKEFEEKFIPYKPYYQTQKGIIYWSDLWKWFEEKLSNFSG